MKVDFKVVMWTRATIDDEDKDKVLKALKSGEIKNTEDLYGFADPEWEDLYHTQEHMTVEENGGEATIEAIEADDPYSIFCEKIIYTNKKSDK